MKKEMENNVNEETIDVEVTEKQEVETFMDKAKSGVKKYWKPAMKIVAGVAVGLAVGYVMGHKNDDSVSETISDTIKDVAESDGVEVTEF